MIKETKQNLAAAGGFLGGRGIALVALAALLTVLEGVLEVRWWLAIPFVIAVGAGLCLADLQLREMAGRRAIKLVDTVVEGIGYVGAQSVCLARREIVCEASEAGGGRRLMVEHLCRTDGGYYFLLRYFYVFGWIYNCIIVPCDEDGVLEFYPGLAGGL